MDDKKMDTIINVSVHNDFIGEIDIKTLELYKIYAKKELAILGYNNIVFDENQQTYSIAASISISSNEYRDIEDALEDAWIHAIN